MKSNSIVDLFVANNTPMDSILFFETVSHNKILIASVNPNNKKSEWFSFMRIGQDKNRMYQNRNRAWFVHADNSAREFAMTSTEWKQRIKKHELYYIRERIGDSMKVVFIDQTRKDNIFYTLRN